MLQCDTCQRVKASHLKVEKNSPTSANSVLEMGRYQYGFHRGLTKYLSTS